MKNPASNLLTESLELKIKNKFILFVYRIVYFFLKVVQDSGGVRGAANTLIVAYALQKTRIVLFLVSDLTELLLKLLHSQNIRIF